MDRNFRKCLNEPMPMADVLTVQPVPALLQRCTATVSDYESFDLYKNESSQAGFLLAMSCQALIEQLPDLKGALELSSIAL